MRTRLPAVLLLCLLSACGSAEPVAAPPSPSPSPSPSPQPVVFDAAAVQGALLTTAEVGAGYAEPDPTLGLTGDRRALSLCQAPEGVTAPPVPATPVRLLQGQTAGFDAVTQVVAVLPDEATAVAVLAAVQRHAARCEPTTRQQFSFLRTQAVQTTERSAVVPVSSGAWRGVRQSSTNVYSATKTQRWTTQHVVLRRGNALLDLEVSGESAPPDLARVLPAAVARLDATLPAQTG